MPHPGVLNKYSSGDLFSSLMLSTNLSLSSSLMHRVARNPAADARGHECQPLRRQVSKCSACVAMLCDGYAE